ncbi:alpha/beta fold hydrolase [Legionella maceachernii]|uniref:Alpha/beta hydrolase n=1 Tax=Legionella maceachernii TaxID=466 RepID=A0A0W0VXC6_9GAMM|nr:alpha/beta hydrolase [Legionella maceachernii]KTD24617.1 alpha/beta hydrolase [Legionella maceachernii]SKA25188.1 Pimeloyl-ACP methyl ester carboxylesterase [Legionella maceachernii]SUO99377.1 Putative non-heme bromoperoxidase BpoC [Legionella maceachernii]
MNNKKILTGFLRKNLLVFLLGFVAYFLNSVSVFALPPLNTKYISYSDAGEGEVLVLIHPFPADKALWAPQQQTLKEHFRLITLDLWGFGHSEGTSGQPIKMEEYADQVAQLLDQLYIKKAIIGGESMGGYVALAFLRKYPEKVGGLILSNTQTAADSSEVKKAREMAAKKVLAQGSEQLINDFIVKALSSDASEQTRLFLQNIVMVQTPTAIASALKGMANREDTANTLVDTKIPFLIITSDRDTVVPPQQSANMHALAKNSKLVVITNAGHLSNLEQPEQWNKAVIEMFANKQIN